MTVSQEQALISYIGDGIETRFDYPFRVDVDSDMATWFDGVMQDPTTYNVHRNADNVGGNVVFISPPPSLVTVWVGRDMPYLQQADYNPYDPFPAETHELALDHIVMMLQQMREYIELLRIRTGFEWGVDGSQPPYAAGEYWAWSSTEKKLITVPGVGDGGGGGNYLPISGGTLTGPLTVNGQVWSWHAGNDPDDGFGIADAAGNWRGSISFNNSIGDIRIVQVAGNDSVQTTMSVFQGRIAMSSAAGYSTLPTDSNHLTTKAYVDSVLGPEGGPFVPISGGTMTGELIVEAHVWTKYNGVDEQTGMGMYDELDRWRGAFEWNHITDNVEVIKADINGDIDTQISLGSGNVTVYSAIGHSLTPTDPAHLTTKAYVDAVLGPEGGPFVPISGGTMTGELFVEEYIWAKENLVKDYAGLGIKDINNVTRAAFEWNTINDSVEMVKLNITEQVDTNLSIGSGKVSMSSATGHSILATEPYHLTTKGYVDEKFTEEGTWLPLTGGTVDGPLVVKEDVKAWAKSGSTTDNGFGAYTENGSLRAAFVWTRATNTTDIYQLEASGAVSTVLILNKGHVGIQSPAGYDITPTLNTHLTTKKYVDDHGDDTYLKLTGGVLTGELNVRASLKATAPDGTTTDFGFGIYDEVDRWRGSITWNRGNSTVDVMQVDTNGTIATRLRFKNGNVTMDSPAGYSTAPVVGNDLCNKTYVDGAAAAATASITSTESTLLGLITELKDTIAILQDRIAVLESA